MPPYFLDFEAFRYRKESFQIKELTMLDVDKPLTPLYYIFAPTNQWQCLTEDERLQFRYQFNHIHQLHWNEGHSRYCKECIWYHVKTVFPYSDRAVTYVMGKEKMDFLQKEFPGLHLVEYNVTFKTLPEIPKTLICPFKEHGEHCTYRKTLRLFQHYTNQ